MDTDRFDAFAKRLSSGRLSRRRALGRGGTGLAAGAFAALGLTRSAASQEATPDPASDATGRDPAMLFVQTYGSGAIAPVDGADGRYTLTLDVGTGQTIYFSDRPDRIVGAAPTPRFLDALGFPPDNPPNAALVVETAPGETDVAVVELFSPVYDADSRGVTYEIEVLDNWVASLDVGFSEAPTDLATLEPTFGAAHLFIDGLFDCPDATMSCHPVGQPGQVVGTIANSEHDGYCSGPNLGNCLPCQPWVGPSFVGGSPIIEGDFRDTWLYWGGECNRRFAACDGNCEASNWCLGHPLTGNYCPGFSS